MSKRERWILMTAALICSMVLAMPSMRAQLQQNGGPGSSVTAAQGTGAAASSRWPMYVTDGTNTMPTGDAAARTIHVTADNASLPVTQSGTWNVNAITTLPALASGTNTVGIVIPKTPCGPTVANQDVTAVPTSSTAVFASTTCLMRAYFNNTNASPQTVTLTDNAGTPLNGVGPAFSVPGLSNLVIPFDGTRFASGVKWSAGGSGVTGAMWGFQ
jgi:hypothetical protein